MAATEVVEEDEEEEDEDLNPSIFVDSLVYLNIEGIIRNSILPDLLNAKMWEFHTKLFFNKINLRFANHGQKDKIFSKLENSLEKLPMYFKVVIIGKITFASPYANIDVNHILTKLENLDVEAQAYYKY